jgi:hypothetical protein
MFAAMWVIPDPVPVWAMVAGAAVLAAVAGIVVVFLRNRTTPPN